MRSNGAVHIGNDSFLAVTRDVTDSVSLFASSFPSEEQLAPLRLSRQTRFHPHADLTCSAAERQQYAEANTSGIGGADQASSTGRAAADAAPGFRHSLHASGDGGKIAAISNTRSHHYIIDITVDPAVVCELEMPEVVRSVCWHPTSPHTLIVLLASGDLSLYDTTRSMHGVVLPLHRRIALRPVVHRCLADAEAQAKRQAAPPASTTSKTEEGRTVKAEDSSSSDNCTPPRRSTAALVASPSPSMFVAAEATPKDALDSSPAATNPSAPRSQGGVRTPSAPSSPRPVDQLPTSQLDLVDIFALPATESTPVLLLVLSSSGDVYAVHLSDAALPAVATAAVTDDGRLRTLAEEAARLAEAAASPLTLEVHHVVRGTDGADEAVAVGGCRIDADAGTYAVFFCTANGFVKGAWVSEPDLLARHRAAHVRAAAAANISFTLQLSGPLVLRPSLSPAVPSTTHGVGLTMTGNVCVLRTGVSGRRTYLIAFPLWDRQRQGWVCWRPAEADAGEGARQAAALPLLSADAAVPSPVAVRLPYDTQDASVALGHSELLLVPELHALDRPCARRSILAVSIASLLRSALYARCGTLQPQPLCGGADGTAPLAKPPAALTDLLNTVPLCHRRWLCAAPPAEVDAATLDLARRVERVTADVHQREAVVQQRRRALADKLTRLDGRAKGMEAMLTTWQQTILDAVVHRRGGDAVRTANERLGKVFVLLNELEQL